jgi:hypothetical protein
MTDNYGRGDVPELKTDEDSGREFYLYPSGMSKWKDTGHFRTGPLSSPISEDPRGMLARRNSKSQQIAREAIDEGANVDPSQWGTGEGWRRVIAHTVETFLKSGNLRGMAETLTKLAVAAGYQSREEDSGGRVTIENVNIADSRALLEVVQMIEPDGRRRREKCPGN